MQKAIYIYTIIILCSVCSINAQNIVKGGGILYTNGVPTIPITPSWLQYKPEIAIDTANNSVLYGASRDNNTWIKLGDALQQTGTSGAPSYTPGDKQSNFAINTSHEIYFYDSGTWYLVSGLDAQQISIIGGTVYLDNSTSISLPDSSATNELQTFSNTTGTLRLSNGGGYWSIPDSSATNELQSFTATAGKGTLRLDQGGGFVVLNDSTSANEGLLTITRNGDSTVYAIISNTIGSNTIWILAGDNITFSGTDTLKISAASASDGNGIYTASGVVADSVYAQIGLNMYNDNPFALGYFANGFALAFDGNERGYVQPGDGYVYVMGADSSLQQLSFLRVNDFAYLSSRNVANTEYTGIQVAYQDVDIDAYNTGTTDESNIHLNTDSIRLTSDQLRINVDTLTIKIAGSHGANGQYMGSNGYLTGWHTFTNVVYFSNDTLYVIENGIADTTVINASGADGNGIYDGTGIVPDSTLAVVNNTKIFGIGNFYGWPGYGTGFSDNGLVLDNGISALISNDSVGGFRSILQLATGQITQNIYDGTNANNIYLNPTGISMTASGGSGSSQMIIKQSETDVTTTFVKMDIDSIHFEKTNTLIQFARDKVVGIGDARSFPTTGGNTDKMLLFYGDGVILTNDDSTNNVAQYLYLGNQDVAQLSVYAVANGTTVTLDSTSVILQTDGNNTSLIKITGDSTYIETPKHRIKADSFYLSIGGLPSAGKILTANADGSATWQSAGGGVTSNTISLSGNTITSTINGTYTDTTLVIGLVNTNLSGNVLTTNVNNVTDTSLIIGLVNANLSGNTATFNVNNVTDTMLVIGGVSATYASDSLSFTVNGVKSSKVYVPTSTISKAPPRIGWDGAGATITTGNTRYWVAPYNCTITGWSIVATGSSPTCTIDIWKVASGTALPTVSNTIMGTKPALSTGNVVRSTTTTGWTTLTITAGDILGFNIDALTVATVLAFTLEVN